MMKNRSSARIGEPIAPTSFAHVVLRTNQTDKCIAWYTNVLHARVVFRNTLICFMTYDDEHHRIAMLQTPEQKCTEPGSGNINHFAYGYRDLGELLSNYYRLKEHGITPVRMINHGPTISFYYRDPDNVMIELQVDNFDSAADAVAFFESHEFAENPVGVFVDPDNLRCCWEESVPWEEIRKRPPMPPGKSVANMRKEIPVATPDPMRVNLDREVLLRASPLPRGRREPRGGNTGQ